MELRDPADADEQAARFEVVELRGPRVLIRLKCDDMAIPPMENVMAIDVRRAS